MYIHKLHKRNSIELNFQAIHIFLPHLTFHSVFLTCQINLLLNMNNILKYQIQVFAMLSA